MKHLLFILLSLTLIFSQVKEVSVEGGVIYQKAIDDGPGGGDPGGPGGEPIGELEAPFASVTVTNTSPNKLLISPVLRSGYTPLINFKFSITGKGTHSISGRNPLAKDLQLGKSVTLDLSNYGINLSNGTNYNFYIWNVTLGIEGASNTDSFLYDESIRNNKVYSYTSGKLTQVKDFKTQIGVNNNTHYTYDASGNMTKDENRGISSITYNQMNLPTQMVKSGTTIQYEYNAAGQRIKKTVGSIVTVYLRDATGRIVAEIEQNKFKHTPIYSGNEVVGQENFDSAGNSKGNFYHLKDHLGNIRTTINSSGTVVSAQDYYPFGMVMAGRTYSSSAHTHTENKHLYQQKERDLETDPDYNQSNGTYGDVGGLDYFEARFYDPDIARFTSVDPHGEMYTSMNSYVAMNNNPLNTIDPTGMDTESAQDDEKTLLQQELDRQNELWSVQRQNMSLFNQYGFGSGFGGGSYGGEWTRVQVGSLNYTTPGGVHTVEPIMEDVFVPNYNLLSGTYMPDYFIVSDVPVVYGNKDMGTKTVIVLIDFLSITKDGKNANNMISRRAAQGYLEGLRTALMNGANIESVAISATTNGEHSTIESRHYVRNGALAIDTGLINGVPPANNRITRIFQWSMNQSSGIRGNFGPTLNSVNGTIVGDQGHGTWVHTSFN